MNDHTVDLGGPVHYVEWPGRDGGPTFLLVHGLGASWINWIPLAGLLARRGRVLALDLIGFGRTPLEGRAATITSNRALVDRFIEDVAGGSVVLIGNSMGGLISLLQAAERPDSVAGLVLIDPASPRAAGMSMDMVVAGMFVTYMIPGAGERFVAARARTLGPEGLVRETLKMCCVDASRVDPEIVDQMVDFARERSETMPYAHTAFLQATRSMIKILARRKQVLEKARAISSPTLLLQGRHDRLVAVGAAEALAHERPDWDFRIFEELGHAPHLEDPRAVHAEIEQWMEGPASRVIGTQRATEV